MSLLCNPFLLQIGQSWNHRILWIERDPKDHIVLTHLLWVGAHSIRPGCPNPRVNHLQTKPEILLLN